ncbi:MAG: hypothetical protein CVU41_01280 [Chloroflexi bacterium HGW-Chloroflexi-3]|nr:MAG: hypothetical protein CVU41_01280 [Chloroflexi bacterium HGW-Chloroflexi-3]
MTEKITCPQCKTENDFSAIKCVNCGFNFQINSVESVSEPDWLAFLRDSKDEDQSTESNLPDTKENFFDLNGSSDDAAPDWLNRIRDIKQADDDFRKIESGKTEELHPPTSSENSDLVHSLRDEDEQLDENSIDWIASLRNIQEPLDDKQIFNLENVDESLEEEISNLPPIIDDIKKDWLIEFPNSLDLENDENITPAEEFPDWLSKTITSKSDNDEILNDIEIPNWLSTDQEVSIEEANTPIEPFNLPDWLSKRNFLVDEETKESSELESSDETENLPGWIKDINQNNEKLIPDQSTSEEESEIGVDQTYNSVLLFNKLDISPSSKSDDGSKPDVLDSDLSESELEVSASEKDQPEKPAFKLEESELKSLSVKPFIGIDEGEDWIDNIQIPTSNDDVFEIDPHRQEVQPKKEEADKHVLPFKFDNVPDWLENIDFDYNEIEPFQTMEEEKNSDSSEVDNIEKGKLPEWLKAIRPIEVVSPDISRLKSQKIIEKFGPLAGLQDVLTSESVTKTYSPPPAYSVTIDVTDKQKSHIRILEEIISPEIQFNKSKKKSKSILHRMEFILIPAFLLLIITYSLFVDHTNLKFPEILPAEAVRFHNLATGYLNRNQEPRHVLVVFETEASSYPEMKLISEGFFENLFFNNHWVTSIATNPNGVLVSERILRNSYLNVPSYNFEERNSNLGYLPGYGIGIQAFLSNPKTTSPGIDLNLNIWEKPPLSEINTINDFDMFVLVTDNSENAKLWIEQINLLVKDSDLLLISSAKASPLLQPYLQTNQIDGMLSGIMGGLAFNLLSQSEMNNIGRFWAIVQLAAIVFVFYILAGGVISIFKKALSSENIEKNK